MNQDDFNNKVRRALTKKIKEIKKKDQKEELMCLELSEDIFDLTVLSEKEIVIVTTALTALTLECNKALGVDEPTLIESIKDFYKERN